MFASGTLLLNALTPMVFADSTLRINGNGAESNNSVDTTSNKKTTVVQDNNADISNNVHSDATTGGNRANENTGGNVSIDTGNARNTTDVRTRANANVADVGNCNCNGDGQSTVTLSGNGFNSNNNASVDTTRNTSLFQNNEANVTNDVTANARTGHNNADRNTGGDVSVLTGHAANDTALSTAVNANVARMGNDGGNGNGTGAELRIHGNGAESSNQIDLNRNNSVSLVQDNQADVRNKVHADATTGKNNANENTDGNVTVDTGNATNRTGVRTLANFNSADLGNCGCLRDDGVFGRISGNGAQSENNITHRSTDELSAFQDGNAAISNDVTSKGSTGKNNANRNTGNLFRGDPVDVVTGHSGSDTTVRNNANVNTFGPGGLQLPGGTDLNFTFDMGNALGSMHL